jgi:DNA-binding CsgD family transcriptional regulator
MKHFLDESQLVGVLETFYDLDMPSDTWLTECLSGLSRVAGVEHDYTGFFYDASDLEQPKLGTPQRLRALPPELRHVWGMFQSALTPAFAEATFRSLFVGSSRASAPEFLGPIVAERERNGHGDIYYLNTLEPSGVGCALLCCVRSPDSSLGPKEQSILRRIANHLTAAYRCRRRAGSDTATLSGATTAESGEIAEAVVDAEGRIVHASGDGRAALAREQIEAAAKNMLVARARAKRTDGYAALELWHPLIAARWTLVDSFESDGRRYVVARENQAQGPQLGPLTGRERQVVLQAALGQSNKEIAYLLGISHSTVRVLIARAARRLGVRTRRELLEHPRLHALRAPGRQRHGERERELERTAPQQRDAAGRAGR